MDILQILLVLGFGHDTICYTLDRIIDSLDRVYHRLGRIREQRLGRIGNHMLLDRLLNRFLNSILHTIETLIGSLSEFVELCQHILTERQVHCLT